MPIWQSEYSEGYEHGLYLAYNLSLDMRFLHPSAWCYWQPIDSQAAPAPGEAPKSWGFINATYDDPKGLDGTLGYVANKYFVMAQYSRHIRPGMRILDSGDQATVAAYDDAAQKLVLVTVRGNSAQNITFDLTRFAVADGTVTGWVTDANPDYSVGRQYSHTASATISGGKLTAFFPAYCIQTFEISARIR
jgi:galactan endo-1,6-beta-galactosidase